MTTIQIEMPPIPLAVILMVIVKLGHILTLFSLRIVDVESHFSYSDDAYIF